jgi:O-antigen ligase
MIRAGPDRHGERQRSAAHRLTLALVWLTVASGAVVVAEPAPVDLLSMMLIVLLPAVGLVRLTPALMSLLAAWLVVAAAAFLAAIPALDVARSATHAGISLYLYLAFAVLAGFIARNPAYHTRVVLNAYVLAATGAALAGLAGSLDLISDIAGALTLHDRASGFFKDPNVYGAFLAPAALVAVHIVVTRPLLRSAVGLVVLALLSLALLASFSRGAWLNFAIALAAYGYLSFVTAPLNRQRLRLVALAAIALAGLVAVIAASLATDTLGRRFEERAELTQSYDVGPDGRFGGQAKAWRLIVENPFGIGALTFAPRHHPEDVHNVYLSMMLNAGWLGGLLFAAMMAMTAVLGLAHALRRTATQ